MAFKMFKQTRIEAIVVVKLLCEILLYETNCQKIDKKLVQTGHIFEPVIFSFVKINSSFLYIFFLDLVLYKK